ncbi:MAG: hypothetical protein ACTHLW_16680 [Verrucomicrobiota bacterium]
MSTSNQPGSVSRKLISWLSIPVILVALVFGGRLAVRYKYQRDRIDWKGATLTRLAGLSLTNEDVSRELETLKGSRGAAEHQEWAGDHVLLMTNDEYMVYGSRHGFSGFVDNLFLARGSDGRWYYSTYHFCNSMAGVRFDDPPASIAEFVSRYAAREFDGKSEVCLEHTWPANR